MARLDAAATAVRDFAQFRDGITDATSKLRVEVRDSLLGAPSGWVAWALCSCAPNGFTRVP